MNHGILHDRRVRNVQWRDLVRPTGVQIVNELLLIFPWLSASLVFAHLANTRHWLWYAPAMLCSFVFFLTGLRVVHNGYHYALGISRQATEWVMLVLSVLMGWSLHAVQVNHLRHHKYCMSDEDVEATSARMSPWRALLFGPVFPLLLLWHGCRHARPNQRWWIAAEILAWLAVVLAVIFWLNVAWLRYHVCCMMIGECMTAFFAVWTVHHDCDRYHVFARTSTGVWKNRLTFNMFLHLEHHLFPAVPTCNLPRLAERLQVAVPDLRKREVFSPDNDSTEGQTLFMTLRKDAFHDAL